MKIKKKLPPIPEHLQTAHIKVPGANREKVLQNTVDKFGEEYESKREAVAALVSDFDSIKKEIRDLVEREATQDGKHMMLTGKSWKIGYVLADREPTIDLKKAVRLLPPLVYLTLLAEPAIDPQKLVDAIQRGVIDPKLANKFLIASPSQKRTMVKRIK